ncbi:GNAT family N-acetyltransferase [Macrococcus capreoli]|uniref:GNAT family N-acetyltransferase n=1 Tax=Macrococcus capreoli TaxID=2982690 RepID=UPI0021D5A0F1|nr:GNAT family N-acetyltransferase [Macrococcus sp. TMW 2.2395]MCU7557997.1 GNAT family N-acetyltransferase [Macrococcus sp. TMW 2.2395]
MIQAINDNNRELVIKWFKEKWGSPEMIISSGRYDCSTLPGLIYIENDVIIGLLTYVIKEKTIEIISLDSLIENKGIGTKLIMFLEQLAYKNCMLKIELITTNDNLRALKFYQKFGFRMIKIIPNAVNEAREIKPQILVIAESGIPINDEIVLEKYL